MTDRNCTFEVLKYEKPAEVIKSFGELCTKPIFNIICQGIFEQTCGPFSKNSDIKVNLMSIYFEIDFYNSLDFAGYNFAYG